MSDTYNPDDPNAEQPYNPDGPQYQTDGTEIPSPRVGEPSPKTNYEGDVGSDGQPPLTPPGTQRGTSVPPEDRPKVWQDYANRAIYSLYPHLREGVDYAYGRRKPEDTPEILEMSDKFAPLDMGKIEEVATRIMESDPYANPENKPAVEGVAPYSTKP